MPSMSDATTPPPPPQHADDSTPTTKKPWWKRWWGIALIVLLVFFLLGTLADDDGGSQRAAHDGDQTTTAGDSEEESAVGPETDDEVEPEADEEADPALDEQADSDIDEAADEAPQEEAEDESAPEPEPDTADAGFGNGTYRIGEDLEPGTYRSTGTSMCYWERLSGFSGELEDIIGNGNDGLEIVTIAESDAGFTSQGCGDWIPVGDTFPEEPSNSFDDGTFVVGEHITPGSYRADGDADDLCYWERLSDFSRAGIDGVIANGNSPTVIEISESDAGFSASGCGTWSQ